MVSDYCGSRGTIHIYINIHIYILIYFIYVLNLIMVDSDSYIVGLWFRVEVYGLDFEGFRVYSTGLRAQSVYYYNTTRRMCHAAPLT